MSNPTIEPVPSAFRFHRAGCEIELRRFQPGDETAFRLLNEQWIAKSFVIEEKDSEVLCDPVGKILNHGGHIFMAVTGTRKIGTCALLVMGSGVFEVAKMAVDEHFRGEGIGRALLEYTIVEARKLGAHRLYLETNNTLSNAVHLYESLGFRHLDPQRVTPSPYARANVFMEKFL
ncbi:MAG TPA: GNAT family N-acetyltransferase [Terracidiphilus sp.]|jgi:GNAT superfamily N-acetyltransferase|nr:GNAT family N-acetyltransferase [Terracidiphilus sp.]